MKRPSRARTTARDGLSSLLRGGFRLRQIDEEIRVQPVGEQHLVDDTLLLGGIPVRRVELLPVPGLELRRVRDLIEEVEADAVGLEPEVSLHELSDVLTTGEVPEVPGVVMGDEAATPTVGGDSVDPLDVADRGRHRGDLREPVRS